MGASSRGGGPERKPRPKDLVRKEHGQLSPAERRARARRRREEEEERERRRKRDAKKASERSLVALEIPLSHFDVDLHGDTVETAEMKISSHLKRLPHGTHTVVVNHGKGQGILRNFVRGGGLARQIARSDRRVRISRVEAVPSNDGLSRLMVSVAS